MNIWVIGRNYPKISNGMQGCFELEQAKLLAKNYEKVSYLTCCLRPINLFFGKQYHVWKEEGVSIHTYSAFFCLESILYMLYQLEIIFGVSFSKK